MMPRNCISYCLIVSDDLFSPFQGGLVGLVDYPDDDEEDEDEEDADSKEESPPLSKKSKLSS